MYRPTLGVYSVCFGVSLLTNATLYVVADRSFWATSQDLARQEILKKNLQEKSREEQSLQFEFVEAPRKVYPRKPSQKTKRIAERDALNQDLTVDKTQSQPEDAPKIDNLTQSNQLEQIEQSQAVAPTPSLTPAPDKTQKKPTLEPPSQAEQAEPHTPSDKDLESGTVHPEPRAAESPSVQTPASTQTPPMMGLTGRDRITTQGMSRVHSRGAKLVGLTSFEATGSGMGEYMKNLKERVWMTWFPPIAFKYPQEFRGADVLIGFTLNRLGHVKIMQVIQDNGNAPFAAYCLDAIQKAGNFGPLPDEILALLGKEEIEIKFAFHYW